MLKSMAECLLTEDPEKPNENLPGRSDNHGADCVRLRSDDVEGGQASRVRAEDRTEDRPKQQKADEAAYKAALDKIPAQKYDPWQNIRGTEPDKNKKNSK